MTRAVVFAYSEVGYRCLGALVNAGVDVTWVVTHRDDPQELRWYRSVAELAASCRLRVAEYETLSAAECLRALRGIAPDFLFSFYFRRMLAPALLATARSGALNMHGSLLPSYRGRAPVNWAIANGESRTGASLHYMVEKPDAGDLVDQEGVDIGVDDTALDVSVKVAAAAEAVMRRSLPRLITGDAGRRPLDLARGSYCRARTPADGEINAGARAWDIHNLVRAVAPPFPGAYADLGKLRLQLLGSRWCNEPAAAPDSAPRLYCENGRFFLDCTDRRRLHITSAAIDSEPLDAGTFNRRFGELVLPLPAQLASAPT
ncbi:MAG TPA: formyltransferase [Steroidobacteraceae bacterium]|nr:formyltransferase [Steroidobacteraceae bacterium]